MSIPQIDGQNGNYSRVVFTNRDNKYVVSTYDIPENTIISTSDEHYVIKNDGIWQSQHDGKLKKINGEVELGDKEYYALMAFAGSDRKIDTNDFTDTTPRDFNDWFKFYTWTRIDYNYQVDYEKDTTNNAYRFQFTTQPEEGLPELLHVELPQETQKPEVPQAQETKPWWKFW